MGWRLFGRRHRNDPQVIDLRDRARGRVPRPAAAARPLPALSAYQYAQLVARRQAEVARAEAQREVEALRRRHWSADRIYEESRLGIDWWEHPQADPHAMLGVLPGDALEDATAARRHIAMAVHPDRVADGGSAADPALAHRQMAAVNSAYDRLRRAYAPLREQPEAPESHTHSGGPLPLRPA
jgi:hypothetical protein